MRPLSLRKALGESRADAMANASTPREAYEALIRRCWDDEEFKKRLLENPAEVLLRPDCLSLSGVSELGRLKTGRRN